MMISIMNNDFDLERNQATVNEPKEPRVSNDGSVALVNERDDSLIEEISVTSGHDLGTRKSGIDENRVLPRPRQEGNYSSIMGETHCRVNGDSGNLVRVESFSENDTVDGDLEVESRVRGEESREAQNEAVTPEAGVIGSSDDCTEGITASNSDVVGDGKQTATCNDVGLERHGELRASESSDVGPSDLNAVVRSGSMKVSSSAFEMGDMVWGKVKSHPWWPGHIFSEAFATSSVRRTRRDGHVLVAFFGDSSYGWFDPTELVPYDPNYAEKSQQTSSRSFMKAVEESVDEASRRSALGLSCRCRNPFNFRPTNVPGYLAVDVVDYEPGAIYSERQIQKARECFLPAATLSFIKQLAAVPMSGESKSLDCIKQKATSLTYRRLTYEEFDETYAQAFGQEPLHRPELPQPPTDKEPSRAPLSGPLVFAEALGGWKSSTKATKPKDLSKKDKYLFKRRDEAGGLRTTRINQVHASFSSSSAHEDGISDKAAANYVFQKRDHTISTNDDLFGTPTTDQVDHTTTKDSPAGLGMAIGPDVSGKRLSLDLTGVPQQSESSAEMTVEVTGVHGHVPGSHISNIISTDAGAVRKKKKVAKRPAGERSSEKPDISEKKKKKKLRKTDGERLPMQIIASSREDSQVSNQKKDDEVSNFVPQQVGSVSLEAARESEVELLQMLADLKGLALNPFHGAERNRPAITRKFFLKFRSLVFLKASSAFYTSESEPSEARGIRSPELAEKPSKPSARQDDPTKGRGRKRLSTERQEEITTKSLKKITDVKSLSGEKRALLKNAEMVRADGKVGPAKKVDRPPRIEEPTYLVMKFQSGSSLPSLAELKARFARFGPLDTSLSRVFYKTNTCRVAFLYKQDANVAYRYAVGSKSVFSNVKFMLRPVEAPEPPKQPSTTGRAEDLQGEPASNRDSSAVEPTPLMHQKPVQELKSCLKKPSVGDEPTGPTNGGTVRTPRVRFNVGEEKDSNRGGGVQMQMESRNATSASSSSEGGPSCSSSSSVAMDVVSNNQRFPSLLPLQPPSLPHPPQFPRVPNPINLPPPQHVEVIPRNNFNYDLTSTTRPPSLPSRPPPPPPLPPSMDISQQMMNLLTRCHDVVTNLKSMLGYVPYHPL